MTNQIKTFLLLGLLSGLFIAIGSYMGGHTGMFIALGLSLVMSVGSYWYSDKIVLRMHNAKELGQADAPGLHRMVGELAVQAGIPKPKIYVIAEPVPNAFATGRDPEHGVVAVTDGIMRLLRPEELRGVLAHEISHIRNRDILIQTVAVVIGSSIVALAHMLQWAAIFGVGRSSDDEGGGGGGIFGALLMAVLAPIAASLIQMALSRSREYLADSTGAHLSHDPLALASALQKIEAYSRGAQMRNLNPATESMYIINPFLGMKISSLFSTHPATEDRVRRLEEIARNPE